MLTSFFVCLFHPGRHLRLASSPFSVKTDIKNLAREKRSLSRKVN
jgi:hypothetical protein